MKYKATERAWVMRLLARLTPDQRRRYEEQMRRAAPHHNSGKKYDDLKASIAERIIFEDNKKAGASTPQPEGQANEPDERRPAGETGDARTPFTSAPPAAPRSRDLFDADDQLTADVERAYRNADEDFKREAYAAGVELSRKMPEWDVSQLWDALPQQFDTQERRAMGGVIARLKEDGIIESTGRTRYAGSSRNSSTNAHPRTIWRSLIYRPHA